jgi:hypothetical protein
MAGILDVLADSHALDDLREAMRITDAAPVERVTPDTCQNCGGHECDLCRPNLVDHSRARLR